MLAEICGPRNQPLLGDEIPSSLLEFRRKNHKVMVYVKCNGLG